MHICLRAAALAMMVSMAVPASALDVDEASYPGASGDYNNLLSPPQPVAVVFSLDAGTNTFAGTFGTPDDQGDTFIVTLGATQTLTSIRVEFATNAGPFDPVAINQNSRLEFDLSSSSSATPLVTLHLVGEPSAPVLFDSGPLAIGPGMYNTTVLTEVLALNSAGMVGYLVAFDVVAVPEPAGLPLMLGGLAALAWGVRRRKACAPG